MSGKNIKPYIINILIITFLMQYTNIININATYEYFGVIYVIRVYFMCSSYSFSQHHEQFGNLKNFFKILTNPLLLFLEIPLKI